MLKKGGLSDTSIPVGVQAALDLKINLSEKEVYVATLDEAGKVPSSQLPSYVDDVKEYADLASLPIAGETGIIYVTLDNNRTYRWSGSIYIEISSQDIKYSCEKYIQLVSETSFPILLSTSTAGKLTKATIDVGSIGTAGTFTVNSNGIPIPELSGVVVANSTISIDFDFEINSRFDIIFTGTVDVTDFTINLQYTTP